MRGLETVNYELADEEVLNATDTAVTIKMPPFEGRVWLSILFSSDVGDSLDSRAWVSVVADAPVITRIFTTDERNDPCALLQLYYAKNQLTPPSGNVSSQANLTAPSASDFPGNKTCYDDASRVFNWGPYLLPPGTTCFDGSYAAFSAPKILTVEGVNFGSGRPPALAVITLIDQRGTRVPCTPAVGNSVLLTGVESTARCIVGGESRSELVSGNVTFVIETAFRKASTADSGGPLLLPVAVCPCGMFAVDNYTCEVCPAGATCAGAREPPRANEEHWDSAGDEYSLLRSNFLPLFKRSPRKYMETLRSTKDFSKLPAFPKCAVPALCKANMRCANGTGGWECVFCQDHEGTSYQRNSEGKCGKCRSSEYNTVRAAVGIAIAAAALLVIAEVSGWRKKHRVLLRRISRCGLQDCKGAIALDNAVFNEVKVKLRADVDFLAAARRKRRHLDPLPEANAAASESNNSVFTRLRYCCGLRRAADVLAWEERVAHDIAVQLHPECADAVDLAAFERWVLRRVYAVDPEQVRLVAVVKLGLNFAQTLSAIANYAKPSAATGGVAGPPGPLPGVLQYFSTFNDIGFSYSAVKCAFVLKYEDRLVGFMAAPFLTLGLPYAALALATFVQRHRPNVLTFKPDAALSTASFYAMLLTFLVLPASINTLAVAQNCAGGEFTGYVVSPRTLLSAHLPAPALYPLLCVRVAQMRLAAICSSTRRSRATTKTSRST